MKLLVLTLVFFAFHSVAQQTTFLRRINAQFHDMPASVVEANNTYVIGGYTKWSMGSDYQYYLVGCNNIGQSVAPNSLYSYNGVCNKMRKAIGGGFLFAGDTLGIGISYSMILKVNSLFNVDWIYHHDSVYQFTDIQPTQDGNYIVVGDNQTTNTIHYIKINQSGNEIWHKQFALSSQMFYPGTTIREVNDGFISSYYSQIFCVSKIDSVGDSLWTKTFQGLNAGAPVYYMNQIYLAGVQPAQYRQDNLNAAALLCLNDVGDSLWTQTYTYNGGDISVSNMNLTLDGNLIISGSGIDTGDTFGYDYAFMLKADLSGNQLWVHFYGIGDSAFETGRDAISTYDGGYLLAGNWEQSSTYFLKVDSLGQFTSLQTIPGQNDLSIYPNPTSDKLFISLNYKDKLQLNVTDVLGKEIISQTLMNGKKELDIHSLASGVYFVSVRDGERNVVRKLIVE
jgi:hypothetical protein